MIDSLVWFHPSVSHEAELWSVPAPSHNSHGGGTSALFSYILDSFRDYATKCLQLNNQVEKQAGNSSQDNNLLIWAESTSEFFERCLFLISHAIYITHIWCWANFSKYTMSWGAKEDKFQA